MRSETRRTVAPFATAVVLAGLMSTTALVAPASAATMERSASLSPNRGITLEQETILSSAAAKALRHIAQARGDIAEGDYDKADDSLGRSLILLDIVEASMPSSAVRDEIWVAKEHLQYEQPPEVVPDLVPIYRSLDELGGLMPTQEAKEHIDKAKAFLKADETDKAEAELQAADSALAIPEVDLPLNATRRFIDLAKHQLQQQTPTGADDALKAAEDSAVYLSVAIHEPLAEAHQSLWRAGQDYAAGAYDAARADINRAIRYLDYATNGADQETRQAVKSLLAEAKSLEKQIQSTPANAPSRLDALWRRAKALSERSVEYFANGWQQIESGSQLRSNLIEAKLHLAYADIDRFTARQPKQANGELMQAQKHLDAALQEATPSQASSLSALRDQVAALAAEQQPNERESDYASLEARLSKLIETI